MSCFSKKLWFYFYSVLCASKVRKCVFSAFFPFFKIWKSRFFLYDCIVFYVWFQCFWPGFMFFFYRCFRSVSVTTVVTLWLQITGESCRLGTGALLQFVVPLAVGNNFREVYVQKPWLTSSCQSNVDSVCVQGSLAITNNNRSHGCSQLVLCLLPLTFPSNVRKTHQGLMIYAIYLLSFINAILQISK